MDDQTLLEVRDFLPLGSRATAAIDKARTYLDAMLGLGRTPSSIVLFAADFDFVFNGVARDFKARFKDSGAAPPPHCRTDVSRHSTRAREG